MSHRITLDTVTAGKCQNSGVGKPLEKSEDPSLYSRRDVLNTATVTGVELGSHLTSPVPCGQRCHLYGQEFTGSWNLRTREGLRICLARDVRCPDE